jgi:hypothetical protein
MAKILVGQLDMAILVMLSKLLMRDSVFTLEHKNGLDHL